MLLIPLAGFWVLLYVGREELGLKGIVFCVALWIALLAGFTALGLPPYWFTAAQALIDAALIIVIFGGDIRIS